jgi:F0F1-type ATP synthase gamma subunit
MKVVASTKLTRAERAMREAKKYGAANNGAWNCCFARARSHVRSRGSVTSQAVLFV